jgi:hypothetical protein
MSPLISGKRQCIDVGDWRVLDLATVMKWSHAISGEMDLDRLLCQ